MQEEIMSDYAINLLKAIETGDQEQMNTAFDNAMMGKVSDAVAAKKIEVAQSIYGGGQEESSEEESTDGEQETVDTSVENGTEEV
jgi:hypothetical protein